MKMRRLRYEKSILGFTDVFTVRRFVFHKPLTRLRRGKMTNNLTEHYINLYKQLHAQDTHYGTTSIRWLPLVQHYVSDLNPDSILDFGCGKNVLIEHIKTERHILRYSYDPAIVEYEVIPVSKVGMVLNIDVMEHIPEDALESTLQNIRSLSAKALFIISCSPAWHKLPDGSNAHCTVHEPEWWEIRLKKHFEHVEKIVLNNEQDILFVTWQVKSHFIPKHRMLRKIVRSLINLLCIIIPVKKWRHYLRDKLPKI